MLKNKLWFSTCNMLVKNHINRNKQYNKAKINIKNIDFIPIIQNNIKWEQFEYLSS